MTKSAREESLILYQTHSHGCDSFTVVWFECEVRKRKTFSTLASARLHASSKVNSLARGEAENNHKNQVCFSVSLARARCIAGFSADPERNDHAL
jgi:hypothetical protein